MDKSRTMMMARIAMDANNCYRCVLANSRSKVVIGEGNLNSRLVLVGEAPGRKEDESGRPFVGSAGKILDGVLESAGLTRRDVYITNILKCRPPKNRRPKKREVELCESYLMEELQVIKPIVVAPMGNISLIFFLKMLGLKRATIGDVHGKVFEVNAPWGRIKLVPLYHPAAAIYNQQLLRELHKDIKLVIGHQDTG